LAWNFWFETSNQRASPIVGGGSRVTFGNQTWQRQKKNTYKWRLSRKTFKWAISIAMFSIFLLFLAAFVWMVNAYAGHGIAISKDEDRII
jgi:hypothetical protein